MNKELIRKMVKDAHIINWDIDGTVCNGESYTPEDCLIAKPRWDVINILNQLSKKKYITMLTARQIHLANSTIKWLNAHNVIHNGISHNKNASDLYVDDKCVHIDDLIEAFK